MKPIQLHYLAVRRPLYEREGHVPSLVFYGTHKLRQDSAFSFRVLWKRNSLLVLLSFPLQRYLIHRTGVGFRIGQVLQHIFSLRKADVVLGETDSTGLPLLLFKRFGILRGKVGFISAGLINNLEQQKFTLLFRFYRWLLQAADFIICWSPLEEHLYNELTGARSRFVLLECDTKFYKPSSTNQTDPFVLCVGRDVGRDWKTLVSALNRTRLPAKLVTSSHRVRDLVLGENIELYTQKVEYKTLLHWYRRARVVVVNLKEIHRFTGQRALLEALGMGKATIVARTKSVVSTYSLKEGREVLFYEPEHTSSLEACLLRLFKNEQLVESLGKHARAFVETIEIDSFANGLRELILSLVQK